MGSVSWAIRTELRNAGCADGEGRSGDRMQPEGERHLQHGGNPDYASIALSFQGNSLETSAYGLHTDSIAPKKMDSQPIAVSPYLLR